MQAWGVASMYLVREFSVIVLVKNPESDEKREWNGIECKKSEKKEMRVVTQPRISDKYR